MTSKSIKFKRVNFSKEYPLVSQLISLTLKNLTTYMMVPSTQLFFNELLGEGYTAHVYRGNVNGQRQAIKVFKRSSDKKSIQEEISCLQDIDHQNIVKLLSYDESYIPRWFGTELCQKHTLIDYILESGPFDEFYARYMFQELLNALIYLHFFKGYAHRDIKPENILFSCEGYKPKLSDLGFMVKIEDKKKVNRDLGTIGYMAPELYLKEEKINTSELPPTDIYSLGVVMFTVVTGYMPYTYDHPSQNKTLQMILQKRWTEFWKHYQVTVSEGFQQMIEGILVEDPKERWDMHKIFSCQWMRESVCTEWQFQEFMESRMKVMIMHES